MLFSFGTGAAVIQGSCSDMVVTKVHWSYTVEFQVLALYSCRHLMFYSVLLLFFFFFLQVSNCFSTEAPMLWDTYLPGLNVILVMFILHHIHLYSFWESKWWMPELLLFTSKAQLILPASCHHLPSQSACCVLLNLSTHYLVPLNTQVTCCISNYWVRWEFWYWK